MNFLSRLAWSFLILFCTQSMFALGETSSPWSNIGIAESFVNSFLDAVAQSEAFTDGEIDDMSNIRDTVMIAMEKMARSNSASKSKLQALNMAFASAIAEIAVVEEGGRSIREKTNVIAEALRLASLQATGNVNAKFVNEIRILISMLGKNNTKQVSYGGSSARRDEDVISRESSGGGYGKSAPTLSASGLRYSPSGSSSYQTSISTSTSGSYNSDSQRFPESGSPRPSRPKQQGGLRNGERQQTLGAGSDQGDYGSGQGGQGGWVQEQTAAGDTQPGGTDIVGQGFYGSGQGGIRGGGSQDRLKGEAAAAGFSAFETEQSGIVGGYGQRGYGSEREVFGGAEAVPSAQVGLEAGTGQSGMSSGKGGLGGAGQNGYESGLRGVGGEASHSSFEPGTAAAILAAAESFVGGYPLGQEGLELEETAAYTPGGTGLDGIGAGQNGFGSGRGVKIAAASTANGAVQGMVFGGSGQGSYGCGQGAYGGVDAVALAAGGAGQAGLERGNAQGGYGSGNGNFQRGDQGGYVSGLRGVGGGASRSSFEPGTAAAILAAAESFIGGSRFGEEGLGLAETASSAPGSTGLGAGQNSFGSEQYSEIASLASAFGTVQGVAFGGYGEGELTGAGTATSSDADSRQSVLGGGLGVGDYGSMQGGLGGVGQGIYGYGQDGLGEAARQSNLRGGTAAAATAAVEAGQGGLFGRSGQGSYGSGQGAFAGAQVGTATAGGSGEGGVGGGIDQLGYSYGLGDVVFGADEGSHAGGTSAPVTTTVETVQGIVAGGYGQVDNGLGQGSLGGGAAAATAIYGGAGQGGLDGGSGQRGSGSGQGGLGGASAVADGAGQVGIGGSGQGGYESGQGGYVSGQGGTSGGGGQGGYNFEQGGQGGLGGYGSGQGVGGGSVAVSASAAASRLSSPAASGRISSAVSTLASSGVSSPGALSNVIGNAVSQISSYSPGLSGCDVLVQALLEFISALVHILSSANIGQINYSTTGESAQLVSQVVSQIIL